MYYRNLFNINNLQIIYSIIYSIYLVYIIYKIKEKKYVLFRELNSLIDEQSYLNQEKVRTWIEGILSKVANFTGGGNDKIIFRGYEPVSKILTL